MKNSALKKLITIFFIIMFALCNIMPTWAEGAPQTLKSATYHVSSQEPTFPSDNNFAALESNSVYIPVSEEPQLISPIEQNTDSEISVFQDEQKEIEDVQQIETNESGKPVISDNTSTHEEPSTNIAEEIIQTEEISAEVVETTTYNIDAITLENIPSYLVESVGLNTVSEEKTPVSLYEKNKTELYSFTTVNADDTHTLYLFNEPIKYIDTDTNEIKFIDNTIIPKLTLSENVSPLEADFNMSASASISPKPQFTGYTNTANSFSVNFPLSINQGVSLETAKGKITLSPSTASVSNASLTNTTFLGTTEQVVEYRDVFGSGTHLQYIPINNGFKENIVLDSYTGVNTFNFLINTGVFYPLYTEGEAIPFADPTTDDIAFILGQVDARDSYVGEDTDGHFTLYNSLSLTEIKSGKYLLTVTVDNDFLTSESTVYPVVIDPSVTIKNTSFRDTSVYSGKPTTQTFYSSSYNIVGYHGSSYGTGIAYIQTKDLTAFNYVDPDRVISATYKVYEGSGKTNSVTVGLYMTQATWQQDTITYNNKPANGSLVDSNTVNKSGYYTFDVTNHIKNTLAWSRERGGYSQTRGFALIASDSSASSKHFCSANYTGSTTPSITIQYTTYPEYDVGTLSKYSSTDEIGEKNYAWGKEIICDFYLYKFTVPEQSVYEIGTFKCNPNSNGLSDTEITLYDSTHTKKHRTSSIENTSIFGNYYAQFSITLSPGTYYVEVAATNPSTAAKYCYLAVDCNNFLSGGNNEDGSREYSLGQKMEEFYVIGPNDETQNCYSHAFGVPQAYTGFSTTLSDFEIEIAASGYVRVSSYQANCVIAYETNFHGSSYPNYISHFSRADDNIITSKLGGGFYVRQKYVDIYYEDSIYGSPAAYFIKS